MNQHQHWTRNLIATFGLAAITLGMAAGCQQRKPPMVNGGPASQEQLERIRESFQSQNPSTRVGQVVDLMPGQNLAAVGDVKVTDFHIGETVCFIDSDSNPIVCGSVLRITADQVHVKYEQPTVGHRTPVPGDIAVGFGDSTVAMAQAAVEANAQATTQPVTQPTTQPAAQP